MIVKPIAKCGAVTLMIAADGGSLSLAGAILSVLERFEREQAKVLGPLREGEFPFTP